MPKKSFALEPGGLKRLTITWQLFWRNLTVTLDDNQIGVVPTQAELVEGRTFPLPDGSILGVRLARTHSGAELRVLRNDKPLPGSGYDPRVRLMQSYGILYFVGGFNFLLGILAVLFEIDLLVEIGLGIFSIAVGAVYLVLAYFVQRRSRLALGIAMALYGLETVLALLSGLVSGVVIRLLFMLIMYQGFSAIKELDAEPVSAIQPAS
jgi:hypothetical protein